MLPLLTSIAGLNVRLVSFLGMLSGSHGAG
jgi:hypothetical protein